MATYEASIGVIFQYQVEPTGMTERSTWQSSEGFVRAGGLTRREAYERLGDVLPDVIRGDLMKTASYAAWEPRAGQPVTQLPAGAEVISVILGSLEAHRTDG